MGAVRGRVGRSQYCSFGACSYADLWEDVHLSDSHNTDLVAQHDKEQQKPVERSAGRSARAEKRAKQC